MSHSEAPNKNEALELWEIAAVILFIVVLTGSVMGNTLIITIFFGFKNLQNSTNCLICNQSIADLLTALFSWYYVSITYIPAGKLFIISNKYACLIFLLAVCISILSAFVNIMAISIERVIAIALPFVHKNSHKKKFVLLWIALTWIGILISSSLPIFGVNQWKQGTPCNAYFVFEKWYLLHCVLYTMFFVLVMTALLNATLGVCVLRQLLKRSKVAPHAKITGQVGSTPKTTQKSNPVQNDLHTRNKRRITIMLLVVVGVFYVCWLPYLSVTCYNLFHPMQYGANTNLVIFHEFTKVFMNVNGLLNPFIYAYRNSHFRKAFKKIFS
ncbi:hypothetical protein CAPTEDRAFT_106827 [Capitella teleta]|uniref:G-protein coupled receptors family 1 profile domain-containing protein n=1 Tax=Capitella teleta TaxID=283909 RepID=R7TQB4_CAPTE|nr:hypothetical protein CAPTEDRAFT_106827 [Capitella teleta]|eukprot:ELT95814.1 hypothetical protein CAPTEDRAFT_106827 [Capitella teleta]